MRSSPKKNMPAQVDQALKNPLKKSKPGTACNYVHILQQLNAQLYGLRREKEEVLSCLRIAELHGFDPEKVPCLVGPKGVGKKSLLAALARATGRKLIHINIGINQGGAAMPVQAPGKVGDLAGQIVHLMHQNRETDLLFLLEGIDFLTLTFRDRTSFGLMEVLAITHEHAVRAGHIECPLDFARALFFATATDRALINRDLLSELDIIHMAGYTDEEKVDVARHHMIPKELKTCGIVGNPVLTDAAIHDIITGYTNEIGLNQLHSAIRKLCRKLMLNAALAPGSPVPDIDSTMLSAYLGHPLVELRKPRQKNQIGVIPTVGLRDGHGVIADLEILLVEDGRPHIILTGNMDSLVREVVMVAISYVRANHTTFGVAKDFCENHTVHANMTPGSAHKSGVSAGLAIVLALISALTGKHISCTTSALGEITLYGRVRKVSGIHEKLLGASRLGLRKIIFPKENMPDIERLPKALYEKLELVGVETIEEAVPHILL